MKVAIRYESINMCAKNNNRMELKFDREIFHFPLSVYIQKNYIQRERHTHILMYIVCTRIYMYVYVCVKHTYIHTYINTHMCVKHTYIHTYIYKYTHVCVFQKGKWASPPTTIVGILSGPQQATRIKGYQSPSAKFRIQIYPHTYSCMRHKYLSTELWRRWK